MALQKLTYTDGVTVIPASNLNAIQDAIIALENKPDNGVSDDLKVALLQLASKVAYIDDQGQQYYDDLYDALYPPKTVVLITAVFEQGSTVIYDDTALNDLKQYLTVTAKYDDNTTAILADSAYTLSGLLEAGTSTVTVAYNGLTTTFTVNVTARPTLSSITAMFTPGQDTPKTIDPTKISAYIWTNGNWLSSDDSYSVCVPVTVGKQYNLHFSTTDSSLVGGVFRYGFSSTDTPSGQHLSGVVRSSPQDLSNVTVTATGQYLVIQLGSGVAFDVISNGYLTLTELARIYDSDTLDSLKANLVVTAMYSDSSTATVAAEDYTLSGTLTEGTSTITVSYGGKTTTFSVTVTHDLYWLPSEYQKVEWIEAQDGPAINTLNALTENSEIWCGIQRVGQQAGATAGYFGKTTPSILMAGTIINFARQTSATFSNSVDVLTSQIHAIILNKTSFTLDGTVKATFSGDLLTITTTRHMMIFAWPQDDNDTPYNVCWARCSYFQIYDNGALQNNLVPCYRKSDSVIGMYDTAVGAFRTNVGSGSFTKGADVT